MEAILGPEIIETIKIFIEAYQNYTIQSFFLCIDSTNIRCLRLY